MKMSPPTSSVALANNPEIAARLFVTTHTVKSHVHNLLEKFAVHTRAQLATLSIDAHANDGRPSND